MPRFLRIPRSRFPRLGGGALDLKALAILAGADPKRLARLTPTTRPQGKRGKP